MPNRNIEDYYLYKYQGQETGKEVFEFRLLDSRIGRWLNPDPYGDFHSPYLGMGNNPISMIDKDGAVSEPPTDCYYGNAPIYWKDSDGEWIMDME